MAINLPERVKKKLEEFQEQWRDFPARWVKPDNIHLTLYFIGYVNNENIVDVIEAVKRACSRSSSFSLNIGDVVYGPTNKNPRMIWAKIKNSDELNDLQTRITKELRDLSLPIHTESRPFNAHLTLCRFNSFNLREWPACAGRPENELPDIDDNNIGETIIVSNIEVMESKLRRGGAEYFVLQSIPL